MFGGDQKFEEPLEETGQVIWRQGSGIFIIANLEMFQPHGIVALVE